MILVDTCIWSLALRRNRRDLNLQERKLSIALRDLIVRGEACVIGPIRQELLSGVSSKGQFELLREQVRLQHELPLTTEIWEIAAEYYNTCKGLGIAPDDIDMTICSAAKWHDAPIFTIDPDFSRYAACLPIALHQISQ